MPSRISSALGSLAILVGLAAGPSWAEGAFVFELRAPSVELMAGGVRLRGAVCRAEARATRFAPILTLVGSNGERSAIALVGDIRGSGCSYYDTVSPGAPPKSVQLCVATLLGSSAPYCRYVDLQQTTL